MGENINIYSENVAVGYFSGVRWPHCPSLSYLQRFC